MRLCLHTEFDGDAPARCRLLAGGAAVNKTLFARGSGRTLRNVRADVAKVRELVLHFLTQRLPVVCSDFKANLRWLRLPYVAERLEAYDVAVASADPLAELAAAPLAAHARIKANAAVVYQYLEDGGVTLNCRPARPLWALDTYSGRSRATVVPLQSLTDENVGSPLGIDRLFVHCDWIAADFRVAALLSGDAELEKSFAAADPYQHVLTLMPDLGLSRDEVKVTLLRALNSYDCDHPLLAAAFPTLAAWLAGSRQRLAAAGSLASLLGRCFAVGADRNEMAAFNATLQGSVAHAMQAAMRLIWEECKDWVFCDVHDSLVLTCRREELPQVLAALQRHMLRPLAELAGVDAAFPFRVSLGKYWRQWKHAATVRAPAEAVDG